MHLTKPSSWSQKTLGIALFVILLGAFAYREPGPGWNQDSRMNAVRAFWDGNGFMIDDYQGNTGDKALYDGHWYSDKAPGGILLALPAFGAAKGVLALAGVDVHVHPGARIATWVATVGSAGLIAALGGLAMFLLLTEWVSRRNAFLATLFLFLGTTIYPYSTMLFSHGMTAGLIAMALWAALAKRTSKAIWRDTLAGLLCGWAIATEYPALFEAAVIFLMARRDWRSGGAFALAAILPILLLLGYQYLCFGTPFTTTYTHSTFLAPNGEDQFGGFPPTAWAVSYLLFSHARGLLLWSPVLLLCAEGLPLLFRRDRMLAAAFGVTIVVHILFAASLNPLDGGWAIGPRHLTITMPFFAIPLALGIARYMRTGFAIGVLSVLIMTMTSLIDPLAASRFSMPLRDLYIPRALAGDWGSSLGSVVGLPGTWSVLPFFALLIAALWIGLTCDPLRRPSASAKRGSGSGASRR